MGMLLNAQAGMTLTQCMGTLASGLYGSVEMLVICDEMARMAVVPCFRKGVERTMQGVPPDDEAELVEMIRQVGHHGSFFEHDYTVKHFREELFFPVLFERQTVTRWVERGALPIVDVAHARVQEILAHAGPAPLPHGADGALDRALRGGIEEFRRLGWER